MNFAEAASTGRAIVLLRFDFDTKKLVPKTGWLELQPNGFLIDRESGNQFYPEAEDYKSDNWRTEDETVKLTAKQILEVFKSYMYALAKKELVQITDGVNQHDLAEDFVRKFDFKELPQTLSAMSDHDFEF